MTESNYRMIKEYKLCKDFRKYLLTNKKFNETHQKYFVILGDADWTACLEKRDKTILRLLRDNASRAVLIRDIKKCNFYIRFFSNNGIECFLKSVVKTDLAIRSELFARIEELEDGLSRQDGKGTKGFL